MINATQCPLQEERPRDTSPAATMLATLAPASLPAAVAGQLSAVIVRYWREACRDGAIRPDKSLDLIDLCPSHGNTRLLMQAIRRRLDAGSGDAYIRYLPVGVQAAAGTEALELASPGIGLQADAPHLVWTPAQEQAAGLLQNEAGQSYVAHNPVVVLAHDAWAKLEQRLYAVHYGKLLRARLDLLATDPEEGGESALWDTVIAIDWDHALTEACTRYLAEFNSAPIVYPSGAFSLIRQLRAQCKGPMLLLALGNGCDDEIGLRLGSFAAIIGEYRANRRLPLNFPLLADWIHRQGGECSSATLGQGRCFQLCLFGSPAPGRWMDRIADCIDPALLCGAEQLSSVMQSLGPGASLESRLNLLQLSRHDPAVFIAAEKALNAAFSNGTDFDRKAWRSALRQVWEHRWAYPTDQRLYQRLAPVVMRCGDWGFARQIIEQGMQECGVDAPGLAQLAWCEIRTGHLDRGGELVEQALVGEPENPLAKQVAERLSIRLATRDQTWRVALRDERLPFLLEPLDDTHADALFHQYRDPQIAVMTGLPALQTVAATREWIAASIAEEGKVNFALMHRDWGFTGLVNLAVSGHAAFFCFWIGVDFQGLGLSSAAGRLVIRHAADQGVTVMLTSAYRDNRRSIRALTRIGFAELSMRACPPDHDRVFFALIDPRAGEVDAAGELRDYYRREQLPMEFDVSPAPDALLDHSEGAL